MRPFTYSPLSARFHHWSNPRRVATTLVPLLCAAIVFAISPAAFAQRLYWDTNPGAAGLGGTGNWDIDPGGTANWSLTAAGTGPNLVWPNTTTTDAVFNGTPGIVTVSEAGVQVRNIDFLASGYVI
ncbi:MAG: hypothetical protein M3R59_08870, partial [Verrucomicrobiota bacterium]|nr:hypothetical protein [Verrucomicrobiota bacterium]